MKHMTQQQLRIFLTKELKLKAPQFRLETWGGRINGSIVSESFTRMGDSERQDRIWNALDRRYGADAKREVGMLLAFSPEEWNIELEGRTNGNSKHYSHVKGN